MIRFTSSIPAALARARRDAASAVETTAHEVAAGAKQRSRVGPTEPHMRDGWEARARENAYGLGWDVVNPVRHTIFNELGTVHMAARPMAVPAAEEARPRFRARMARILSRS